MAAALISGDVATTRMVGEEHGFPARMATTMAMGEEDGDVTNPHPAWLPPWLWAKKMAAMLELVPTEMYYRVPALAAWLPLGWSRAKKMAAIGFSLPWLLHGMTSNPSFRYLVPIIRS